MCAGGCRREAAWPRYGAAEAGASAAEENQFEAGEARWPWAMGKFEPQMCLHHWSGIEGRP